MKSKFWKLGGSALLALALTAIPALSHASTISSGDFVSGAVSPTTPVAGSPLTITIVGTLGTFTLTTGDLVAVTSSIFSYTGGTLSVGVFPLGSFTDAITDGVIFVGGGGSFGASGNLAPLPGLTTGSTSLNWTFTNGGISGGTAGVNFIGSIAFIPEPGTLGLMGTGLIGLAGLLRRKLNL